jgi:hypothetical protein
MIDFPIFRVTRVLYLEFHIGLNIISTARNANFARRYENYISKEGSLKII